MKILMQKRDEVSAIDIPWVKPWDPREDLDALCLDALVGASDS